ncbi:MAG: hypothetical protein PHV53_08245 [Fermentimonas sp.]|nr:hypothetical protein [Fermentimonas sp.]
MSNKYKSLLILIVIFSLLFGGFACSVPDDYITEAEARRMIEQALRDQNPSNGLSQTEIQKLIDDAINKNNNSLEFTNWEIINLTVEQADWVWNENALQWEAIFDMPELTEFIYEQGAQLGYVFIGEQGVNEVQKLLPYVDTYYAGDDDFGNPVYFTETISVDYQFGNPSTVAFFIKDSQLAKDPDAPQLYNFRIVLIW